MNEQKKRDLMLEAAVQFKGEWPDSYEALVVSTETNDCWGAGTYQDFTGGKVRFNSVMDDADTWLWVCTREEFEGLMQSLFEGAPEGATHYGNNCYFMKSGKKWWGIGLNDRVWQKCFGGLDVSNLIPRPRKQPEFLGDAIKRSIDQAYNEVINKASNTSTMNDDVSYVRMDGSEWSGEGLPPVGVKCEFRCTARGKEYSDVVGVVKYMSEYTCVMSLGGSEFVAHPDTMTFRPLKTEAEKEREELIKSLYEIFAHGDTLHKSIESLIDAGWRPNE